MKFSTWWESSIAHYRFAFPSSENMGALRSTMGAIPIRIVSTDGVVGLYFKALLPCYLCVIIAKVSLLRKGEKGNLMWCEQQKLPSRQSMASNATFGSVETLWGIFSATSRRHRMLNNIILNYSTPPIFWNLSHGRINTYVSNYDQSLRN